MIYVSPYLIFVIFFTRAKFLEKKLTPKKRVNYDKIHSKLPIFCVITAKYTVNFQIFTLNLKKFTPAKNNLHKYIRGVRDKYEVCALHCTMCSLGNMFSFQPNKMKHILKFMCWYMNQHTGCFFWLVCPEKIKVFQLFLL